MENRTACSDVNCKGEIDRNKVVEVPAGWNATVRTHPCSVCGLLHKQDGTALDDRGGKAFLRAGKTMVVRLPDGGEVTAVCNVYP